MRDDIRDALNNINVVNQLNIAHRVTIGHIVVEVNGTLSVNDALIIRNILLLLNQAGKFVSLTRPLKVSDWFTVYDARFYKPADKPLEVVMSEDGIKELTKREAKKKKQEKKQEKMKQRDVDAIDALRYALCDVADDAKEMSDSIAKPMKEIKDISGNKISISDVNLVLDNEDTLGIKEMLNREPKKLEGGIPESFKEDRWNPDNKALAKKYNRTVATIRRWRRELIKQEQGGKENESSQ